MEKSYDYSSIKKVLTQVTICTNLHCTKNGEVYSPAAEEFLSWINKYTKYCLPEEVENWKKINRNLIYSPVVLKHNVENTPELKRLIESREYEIIDNLYNFINAGQIMEILATTNNSWDKVSETLESQGHTGWTFTGLSNVMLLFSHHGIDFINKYDPNRPQRDKKFEKIYTQKLTKKETNN